MCSGLIVSSAANAGPGKRTETAFPPFEPAAPPSAHTARFNMAISAAKALLRTIACIDKYSPDEQRSSLAERLL
jgi:hypothetical protein